MGSPVDVLPRSNTAKSVQVSEKKSWKTPQLDRLELGKTASAPPQPGGNENGYNTNRPSPGS